MVKTIRELPFRGLESIPQAIKDFLDQKISGFEDKFFSVENFAAQISAKGKSFKVSQRALIQNAFKSQLSDFSLSDLQQKNIANLSGENTFTVTTGHQLNLFSGPAFFIYKILQTVKTCSFLKDHFPESEFVPVFWMASEDHDFDEINHFKTENAFYEINEKSGNAVGKIVVSDVSFISEFEKEFKDSLFGTELIMMLKESYTKGNTLAQATKILVQRLFSHYGLLVLDGNDADLKKTMIPVFEDELKNFSLSEKTKKKVNFLSDKYGKVQVNPREINLFYLSETRNRIDFDGKNYIAVDTEIRFLEEEIVSELHRHPEKFSPNALMRPVYQESILPNLAYIGGNAEIMYWLELKDYFDEINVPFPVLIPRNSMLFVKQKTLDKLGKLNLEIEDFFGSFAKVTEKKLLENSDIPKLLDEKQHQLETAFEEIKKLAETTEKSFGNLVKAEKTRQLKSFKRMRKRLLHAEKIKQNELMERLEKLFAEIHPAKIWQERVFNFSVFYADFGIEWIDFCLREMPADQSELLIVAI